MTENSSGNFILLVEDNPDDAELALRACQDGVAVPILVMEDGRQALDFIFNTRPAPLLVLLDLNLPKIGGLQVLEAIRSYYRTRTVPVIVLTGSDDDRERLAAEKCNADAYLQKPLDRERFNQLLQGMGLHSLSVT